MKRRNLIWILLPLLIALSCAIGINIGSNMNGWQNRQSQNTPISGLNKLGYIFNLVQNMYVDSIHTQELEDKTIPHLLEKLDPHSAYIPASEMKNVKEDMQGNFGGIGIQFFIQEDTIRVVDVVANGPSQKLGVLPGDKIIRINDSIIAGNGVKNEDVMKRLRGKIDTQVQITVKRSGIDDSINFDITRGTIPLYSIDVSYMIDKKIGYVKIGRFAEQTYKEFMDAIRKLQTQGAQQYIIDVRSNPGGYLQIVTQMVTEFLNKDDLIVYTQGRTSPKKIYKAPKNGECKDAKVVVLIDEFSASASEIFAGAIQDNDRGTIIGRRSFGKGLVQEQIPFNDGSALRLTTARFYTPSGRCIQKSYENGVEEYYKDIYNRISHDELVEKDSIHFADSLKYHTISGRVVYGGGGIMPDIFTPVDTTYYSPYFGKVTAKGYTFRFAYEYVDSHRDELKKFSTTQELLDYLEQDHILDQFIAYTQSNKVSPTKNDLKHSKEVIDTRVKANICQDALGPEGYYQAILKIDDTLQRGIQYLEKGK